MVEQIKYGGKQYSFQVDSEIVQKAYIEMDNYLIEYDDNYKTSNLCAIYFCSHDIYYPNNEEQFTKRIVNKNFFEWYRLRVPNVYKHIFVRDVFKQWYFKGISAKIDTPEKLFLFLQRETEGYKTICVGSSAGGYAAILYGSRLKSDKVYAFNSRFEFSKKLKNSNEMKDPLLFRMRHEMERFHDLKKIVDFSATDVYYFQSINSKLDKPQGLHVKDVEAIHKIRFKTSIHGVPFLKVAIPSVFAMSKEELNKFESKLNFPILFTIGRVGLYKTIVGFYNQYQASKNKRK